MIKEARWSGWVWVGECSFWYRPTRVVPDQRPLNGRCCCCCCRTGLVVQVVSALLCDNWQDFNWHDASRGLSAIAEFLLRYSSSTTFQHFTVFAPATVLFLWRKKLKRDKCSDFSVVISLRRYIVHLEDAAGGVGNSTTYNNCYSKPDSDKPRAT